MSDGFSVHITRAVEDDLKDLRPHRKQVIRKLLILEKDPYKGHTLKGVLRGLRSLEFSLPGGACRAIYAVKEKERVCLVVVAGYHEGFYAKTERRVRALKREGLLK